MKLTEYIKLIECLIKEDGDLDVESVVINDNAFSIMINNEWMVFNEYEEYKKKIKCNK